MDTRPCSVCGGGDDEGDDHDGSKIVYKPLSLPMFLTLKYEKNQSTFIIFLSSHRTTLLLEIDGFELRWYFNWRAKQ